ncbi:alcohol dehydrogenase catalytic domain-containing protein [Streptomyces sp. NPDC018955]|uniref:alcohol dehydrogenase catalytic domain-containing protein n=1 Tax=Streptomyces sp. NPDC018955 TaxID=3365055 RepID=UPI0037B7D17F
MTGVMPHLDDTGENDDVVALLKQQHNHIRDLFAEVESATDDDREEAFRTLVRAGIGRGPAAGRAAHHPRQTRREARGAAEPPRWRGGSAVKALCWEGVNKLTVEQVPDPILRNDQDVIVRLIAGTTCGSDLHLIGGYTPFIRSGDVIGHEFLGEVVEVGAEVRRHKVGGRVVVCSFVGCGRCRYCTHNLWSLCDNTDPGIGQALFGADTGGIFGYSHAMARLRGSHAEYVRVPFANYGAFPVLQPVRARAVRPGAAMRT